MKWMHRVFAVTTLGRTVIWLLCIAATLLLGTVFDCRFNESGAQACVVAGRDAGDFAYTMGMLSSWGVIFFAYVIIMSGITWTIFAFLTRRRA